MKKQKAVILGILLAMMGLAGCGSSTETTEGAGNDAAAVEITGNDAAVNKESGSAESGNIFVQAEVNEDGNIVIDTSNISSDATFVNYEVDGVIIQLIAVQASDGSVRMSFNTCQSCNPSPRAYFIQQEDVFICQNCGNRFTADQVGVERGGCNPAPVEATQDEDGNFVIEAAYLDQYKNNFASWQGVTE